jgi:RIO kinase 1
MPRAHRRWDDDDTSLTLQLPEPFTAADGEPAPAPMPSLDGGTWAAYADADALGPQPPPAWVVIDDAAVDVDRGIVKTGKEADVHLVERTAPDGHRCLLAAKSYRSRDHRMFHRDAGYLEGRRVRRSRETRAMANRTALGRELISGQWAWAEHAALSRLWSLGLPVPYPVQLDGTRLLIEFIGDDDGVAAPRLAQVRAERARLAPLWTDLYAAMNALAEAGYTHGDLSAYNVLVHHDRIVMIDLPQIVDVVGNPLGPEFLRRDVVNVCNWFNAHGVALDADVISDELLDVALRRT